MTSTFKLYFHYLNIHDSLAKLEQSLKVVFDDLDDKKALIFFLKKRTITCKTLFDKLTPTDTFNFLQEYFKYKLGLNKQLNKKNPYLIFEKNQLKLYPNIVFLTNEISKKYKLKLILLPC